MSYLKKNKKGGKINISSYNKNNDLTETLKFLKSTNKEIIFNKEKELDKKIKEILDQNNYTNRNIDNVIKNIKNYTNDKRKKIEKKLKENNYSDDKIEQIIDIFLLNYDYDEKLDEILNNIILYNAYVTPELFNLLNKEQKKFFNLHFKQIDELTNNKIKQLKDKNCSSCLKNPDYIDIGLNDINDINELRKNYKNKFHFHLNTKNNQLEFSNEEFENSIYNNFENFYNTNNGIIHIKKEKEVKGGDSLCYIYDGETSINECKSKKPELTDDTVINQLVLFKNDINKNNKDDNDILSKFIEKNNKKDESDTETPLQNTIASIFSFINTSDNQDEIDKYENLKKFIIKNKDYKDDKIIIDYMPKYSYKDCTFEIDDFTNQVIVDSSYYEYNKDIVTAFQKDYIDSKDDFLNLIKMQKEYIKNLSITKKRIIQDYTKFSCFDFYNKYKSSVNDDWFNNADFKFGDSYYATIYLIYKSDLDKYKSIKNKINECFCKIEKEYEFDIYYTIWLFNHRKEPDSDFILKKCEFNIDEWKLILDTFIENINYIIKEAPTSDKEIHCYRGVSFHYIKDTDNPIICIFNKAKIMGEKSKKEGYISKSKHIINSIKIFKSTRLSSYSLCFHVSYHYHNMGNNKDKRCMYKTTIMPGCNILYVAPLSYAPQEFEFISPVNSIFLYDRDVTNENISKNTSYNNIDRKFGVFSKEENSFHTFYNILFNTPKITDNERNIMNFDPFPIPYSHNQISFYFKRSKVMELLARHGEFDKNFDEIKTRINEILRSEFKVN